MADIEIIEQKPISMMEVKDKLDNVKKEKGELNFRAEKVNVYLSDFVGKKKVEELRDEINNLGISKLRDRHIIKIIDIMPNDIESLKIIFVGETVTLKQDEAQKIIDVLNK